jgi:hypothetical protein
MFCAYENCLYLKKINLVLYVSYIYEVNMFFLAFLRSLEANRSFTSKMDPSVREFSALDSFVCPKVPAKLRLYCAPNRKLLVLKTELYE